MEQSRHRKSQRQAQCYEVPESGKAENEDQAAADCKEQADEPSAYCELVHGDTGMRLLRHRNVVEGIIPLAGAARKALIPGQGDPSIRG